MKRLSQTALLAIAVAGICCFSSDALAKGKGKGKQQQQQQGFQQDATQGVQPNQADPSQFDRKQQSQFEQYDGSRLGPKQQRLAPRGGELPRLGFYSKFMHRYGFVGEYVTRVDYHSPAFYIGLEPGDIILSVNGHALHTPKCWYESIAKAAKHDGWVTLKIRDMRSGRVVYRTANLFHASGE